MFYKVTPYLLLLITFTFIEFSYSKRDFSVILETCSITSQSDICSANCSITKIKGTNRLSVYGNLTNSAKYGVSLKLRGKNSANDYFSLYEGAIDDVCPHIRQNKRNNMLLMLFDDISHYGHLPKCPIEKDLYYLKDYAFPADLLPTYLPEFEFEVKTAYFLYPENKRSKCFDVKVTGQVVSLKNPFFKKHKT